MNRVLELKRCIQLNLAEIELLEKRIASKSKRIKVPHAQIEEHKFALSERKAELAILRSELNGMLIFK